MSYSPNTPIVSTSNSTSTALTANGTFTGTAELAPRGELLVQSKSDVGGTLYFDFSTDGTNWDSTFPSAGYTCAAAIPEVHRAVIGGRYFRVRYVNGAVSQSYLRLQTSFAQMGPLSSPIGNTIASDADAVVVKAIVSGVGDTNAVVTDHQALQVTSPPEGKTSFGEQLIGQLTPIIQLTFPYSTIPQAMVTQMPNQSGTVTSSTSMMVLQTGAAANSSACAMSRNRVKYRAGMGVRARFTALFTTGATGSEQIIGIGDSGNGLFFGYNGATFGVLRRYGGNPTIRTFTVTTASSTNENITVTLDGQSTADVIAVTNSANATTTANEIARGDYSDVGPGWSAVAVGNTVVFTSWDSAPHTGSFGIGSVTTAAVSTAETLAGVAPTDVWVAQSSWNGADIFDGNGVTGVTLDPTKGNVFQIDFQYLGFGAIRFYIEDPDDGELHIVHQIEYANANTRPSLDNPTLPLYACAKNTSNATNITLKTASMAAFVDGVPRNNDPLRGISNQKTLTGTASETPILSIRVAETFGTSINRSKIKINFVAAAVEHTKPVQIKFYANPELTSASWTAVGGSESAVFYDISATAVSTANRGTFLHGIALGKTGNGQISLIDDDLFAEFSPGDSLVVTALPNSANGAECTVSINFTEKY